MILFLIVNLKSYLYFLRISQIHGVNLLSDLKLAINCQHFNYSSLSWEGQACTLAQLSLGFHTV